MAHAGSRIRAHAQKLLGQVHGIQRHHDSIGAQDRVVGDHELRAVLHVEEHAIARGPRSTSRDSPPGVCFGEHFRETDPGVVIDQAGLVRTAPRRDLEVVKHVRGRREMGL